MVLSWSSSLSVSSKIALNRSRGAPYGAPTTRSATKTVSSGSGGGGGGPGGVEPGSKVVGSGKLGQAGCFRLTVVAP